MEDNHVPSGETLDGTNIETEISQSPEKIIQEPILNTIRSPLRGVPIEIPVSKSRRAVAMATVVAARNNMAAEDVAYPSQNAANPICRQFVNRGSCLKGLKCKFYHPPTITDSIRRTTRRDFGFCYCGAIQRTIIKTRPYRSDDISNDGPTFFRVCGITGKSMKNCM